MGEDTSRIDSMEPNKTETTFSRSYPLEFHYLKALFLQQKWRMCISTCRDILEAAQRSTEARHPLEQTFLRLYIALAHDELARAMHPFSSTKLAAFDQAESLYHEAAAAIPDVDNCRHAMQKLFSIQLQVNDRATESMQQSDSQSTLNSDVFRRPPSPSPFRSPPMQPQTTSFDSTSPGSSGSEFDADLESQDNFDELVTPNHLPRLPSTFSSMSLLDPHKQTHGLMRPIRPGSVAKPYAAPPQISLSPTQHRSRLPRLNTTSSLGSPRRTPPRQSSPVRKQLRSDDEVWSPLGSPTSPVSPLGSASIGSDDLTISPMSPSTPVTARYDSEFGLMPAKYEPRQADPLTTHLHALLAQTNSHINLIQEAKQRTVIAQAERTAKNNMRKVPPSRAEAKQGNMPQSRSFWLFTPQDVKAMDKQRRIQEGRQRVWARPRFDAGRYRELAERALAEL